MAGGPEQNRLRKAALTEGVLVVQASMGLSYPWFVKPCFEAFDYLQTRYGFAAPTVDQVGLDCYVRYRNGIRWVCIGYRIGCKPVVELYTPTCRLKDRRKPTLDLGLSVGESFADTNEPDQLRMLRTQAADLEIKEQGFLSGSLGEKNPARTAQTGWERRFQSRAWLEE